MPQLPRRGVKPLHKRAHRLIDKSKKDVQHESKVNEAKSQSRPTRSRDNKRTKKKDEEDALNADPQSSDSSDGGKKPAETKGPPSKENGHKSAKRSKSSPQNKPMATIDTTAKQKSGQLKNIHVAKSKPPQQLAGMKRTRAQRETEKAEPSPEDSDEGELFKEYNSSQHAKRKFGSSQTYGKSQASVSHSKSSQTSDKPGLRPAPDFAGTPPPSSRPEVRFIHPLSSLEENGDIDLTVVSEAEKVPLHVVDSSDSDPLSEPDEGMATPPHLAQGASFLTDSCPLCGAIVLQSFLEEFNGGKPLKWRDKAAFCKAHKVEKTKKRVTDEGYPGINWEKLPARICKYDDTIDEILDLKRDSYYRKEVQSLLDTGKIHSALNNVTEVDSETSKAIIPGYYGTKGLRVMQEHILSSFGPRIRELSTTDPLIPSVGVAGYVQYVLARELAVLLVIEDYKKDKITAERAREIIVDSVDVGQLVSADTGEGATQARLVWDLTSDK